jgi:uncharacterized membrane protein
MYQPLRSPSENFPNFIRPLLAPMAEALFWRIAFRASMARRQANIA